MKEGGGRVQVGGGIKKGGKEVRVPEYLCMTGEGRGVRLPRTVSGHRQSISGVSATPANHYYRRKKDLVQDVYMHAHVHGVCVCVCVCVHVSSD